MEHISIVIDILMLCVTVLSTYLKVKGDIYKMALELIGIAEQMDTSGENKMGYVVDSIYKRLPPVIKNVIGVETIRMLAQTAFDGMKVYFKAKTGEADIDETVDETAGILVCLLDYTVEELTEKANRAGINIEPTDGKEEIARKLVDYILN